MTFYLANSEFYAKLTIEHHEQYLLQTNKHFENWVVEKYSEHVIGAIETDNDGFIDVADVGTINGEICTYKLTLLFKSEEDKTLFVLKYL